MLLLRTIILTVLSILLCVRPSGAQPVLYVDADAAPNGDGLTWGTAFLDLQDALQVGSGSGGVFQEIWVAEGIYAPDRGTGDRAATFALFSGLKLRGGFTGGEASLAARPEPLALTVLTGEIGQTLSTLDNSYHVLSMRAVFQPVTIEGFTIRAGRSDAGSFPDNSGGGFLNEGIATIERCVFEQNYAVSGGGLFSRFGAAFVRDCAFNSNTSASEGGGAVVRDGGEVVRCRFVGNNGAFGGGLWLCCAPIRVRDSVFLSNFGNFGGGLFNSNGGPSVARCVFIDNSASRGGGMYAGTNLVCVSCFFGGNSADRGGGYYGNGSSAIANGVFTRNFALSSGGAAWAAAALEVSSSTLHGNNALLFAGGLYFETGASAVSNSIVWSNTEGGGSSQSAQITRVGGTLALNFSCVQGLTGSFGGIGNIASPPQFVNPAGSDGVPGTADDDLRLSGSSPCIDAGDASRLPIDASDVDDNAVTQEALPLDAVGTVRRLEHVFVLPNGPPGGALLDIGAYERVPPVRITGDANGDMLVNFADVTAVLSSWGSTLVPADVNDDLTVDFSDLTIVLANWTNGP